MKLRKFNILSFVFIIILFTPKINAQEYPMPLIVKGELGDPTYGLNKKSTYEVIYETNISKKEVITKTKEVLESIGFLNLDKINPDKINDKQDQYKFTEMGFKSGLYYGKGKSGLSKRMKNPAILHFDMIIDFYESSKVKITISNFEEVAFFKVNNDMKFHLEAGFGNMLTAGTSVSDERHTKVNEIEAKVLKAGSAFGKFSTVMDNGGLNFKLKLSANGIDFKTDPNLKKAFESLKTSLTDEFKIYDQAVKDKIGIWYTPTKDAAFLTLYQDLTPKQKEHIEEVKQRMTEDVLLTIDNDRFEKYFEKYFNEIFFTAAGYVNGKNIQIARDGEIKYQLNDKGEIVRIKNKK